MGITSVTFINGTRLSGKSYIASYLNKNADTFVIEEDYRLKKDIIELLHNWKTAEFSRHVVLVGSRIYETIDFDFGPVPKFFIQCSVERPFVMPKDDKGKPLCE